MKGVILAGGTGTRLYPLTKVTNKHLLPVGKEPMIFNPVRQLISAGITEILVVTGKEHMGEIVRLLGSGCDFNCSFTFRVQETAGGIADALALARVFANGDRIVVILGDNILTHSIRKYVESFQKQPSGAKVLLKRVGDPERFGVAALDEQKKMIIQIDEKPEKPKSDYAVIGVYMYDFRVFDVIQTIKPSDRGELEITSVNNWYVEHDALTYNMINGEWTDAGTFESLMQANRMLFAVNNIIQDDEV
ncbi:MULTISPECIES: sugar phosphate nucleotidyltransferase [unclassified Methanoregula]|uniref:sugar phosphate nucleotidyltransferase n=1 Tax=unclassified Methanoregula TaxID=2649730 RepID=UPI0009CD99B5|nr:MULTISPECIES: sugar phosphate nucleotidyltransferase [unclassified Methanoregula]OPX65127.1 MAG: Bifunctional protein GlmU [Methanoregula sp. PtaB.Bin085]OPY32039.1 MAG: Bifunctional protein GlmU [Methanoregula sp. PtaU1.Bin006]